MFKFTLKFHVKIQQSYLIMQQKRSYALKELPWCSKSNSSRKNNNIEVSRKEETYQPIDRFGIVAAMSKNHIIGVNGRLPWNVPDDRMDFVSTTTDKILIIGRRTFEEQTTLSHISHVAKCIVMSKTLQNEAINASFLSFDKEIQVVRSFPEALDLARRMANNKSKQTADDPSNDTQCWVAGGEVVYKLAVLHPSACMLHLTVIDMDVDIGSYAPEEVTRFPPKYHWATRFRLASAIDSVSNDGVSIKFTKYIYRKPAIV
jgi:dihydrofolate reductase